MGAPAKPSWMALGALIIKERLGISVEETVAQIQENPYLQYFIGLEEFIMKAPFDVSMMVHFRKRITPEMISEITEHIIGEEDTHGDANRQDGMDGLASGIVMIASLFLAIIGGLQGMVVVTFLAIALMGAIGGFFIFNYPPAKIFMGDGGAYFLGFMYAILPLIGIKKVSTITVFFVPLVLLLIPLIDMAHVIQNRFIGGYHIFLADRNHIHHRLLHIGFSNKGILWILYSYTAILGCFSIVLLYLKPHQSIIVMVLLFLLTVLAFFTISVAERRIAQLEGTTNNKKSNKGLLKHIAKHKFSKA